MLHISVFIMKYVVLFYIVILPVKGYVNLELLTKPVVFGESLQLACIANETEITLDKPNRRSWAGGPYNALLCMNGISANRLKYNEIPGKDKSQYILKISNFSESDVDYDYTCVHGVYMTRQTLQLNEADYEYIPSRETITVAASLRHGHFSVNVHFAKVWPTPRCEIQFENIRFGRSIEMSKKKNGKLYSVDISLQHTFRKEDCTGEMLIFCQIGTKHIDVQRKHFHTCPFTVPNKNKNIPNDMMVIALVSAVVMILVTGFVAMISLIIKQKRCTKSITEHYFGYNGRTPTDLTMNKEPFLTDFQLKIHL